MYACPFTHDNVNNTISRIPLIAGRSLDVIPENLHEEIAIL